MSRTRRFVAGTTTANCRSRCVDCSVTLISACIPAARSPSTDKSVTITNYNICPSLFPAVASTLKSWIWQGPTHADNVCSQPVQLSVWPSANNGNKWRYPLNICRVFYVYCNAEAIAVQSGALAVCEQCSDISSRALFSLIPLQCSVLMAIFTTKKYVVFQKVMLLFIF